jgi:hypothetical protein
VTASSRGLGDGAPLDVCPSCGTTDSPACSSGWHIAWIRSELARVQDERDQAREARDEAIEVADDLAAKYTRGEVELGEAREALRVIAERFLHPEDAQDIARAALAASGVTEKGDGTDGR